MQAMWSDPVPTFRGPTVTIEGVELLPAPHRRGGPPIIVGGHSQAAFDRAARVGDGWLGWSLRPDQAARHVERLRGCARADGRSPLEISVMPAERLTPEAVDAFAAAGVHRLVVTPHPALDAAGVLRFVEHNSPARLGAA